MRLALAGAAALVTGAILLAFAAAWLRTQCLPVDSYEVGKWQCRLTPWIVGLAYFASLCIATLLPARHGLLLALLCFPVLFLAHTYLPWLGLVSFGKSWMVNPDAIWQGLAPALAGAAAGVRLKRPFKRSALWIAGALSAALFGFAFFAAPQSCEWGLEAYTWTAIVLLPVLFALPLALPMSERYLWRFLAAFGFVLGWIGVWFGSMVAANMQILCRLF